jgi:siroheme synthase-like protein
MKYLPVGLNLKGRWCVVIGGGRVAVRKVETLLEAGGKVRLVSPQLAPRLKQLVQAGRIEWKPRRWKRCDLDRAWLVIVATGDREVNRKIKNEATRQKIWVNAVDDPENCTIIFPAFFNRGGIQIAVGTSGQSPALARKIREQLESEWDPQAGKCLEWIGKFRGQVKAKLADPEQRFNFWDQALTPKVLKLIQRGKTAELKRALQTAFKKVQSAR